MKSPRHNIMVESIGWATRPVIQYEEYMDDNRNDYIDSGIALVNFVKRNAKELDQYVEYHHSVEVDNFFAVPLQHLIQLGAKFDPNFVRHIKQFPKIRVDGNIIEFNLDNETVTLYI